MLSLLVLRCTSPVSSDFPDRVARRLSAFGKDLNVAAASYAIDLAKALNLLNANLVWTNLGHLLSVVSVGEPAGSAAELSEAERVAFFRIFLEFDGAALIFFAKKIEAQDTVPGPHESWPQVAQELFESTYDEYLGFVTDTQTRIRVRQLAERRRGRPFQGKSGAHQSWVHIHTLHRLRLVEKVEECNARVYKGKRPVCGVQRPTAKLIEVVPDLKTLEDVIYERACYDVASEVFGCADSEGELSDGDFVCKVRSVYDCVMATGVALCPIQTLAEAIQVQSVAEHRRPPRMENIVTRLRNMQQTASDEIRFHVDRSGYPAYIKMD